MGEETQHLVNGAITAVNVRLTVIAPYMRSNEEFQLQTAAGNLMNHVII